MSRPYFTPTKGLSLKDPEGLYKAWLSGQSLRSLGSELGCSHNTVAAVLKRHYGPMATNLVARSLERTLVQDYGVGHIEYAFYLATTNPEGDGQKHRSRHNLRQLTAYQSSGRDHVIEVVASLDAEANYKEALEREQDAGSYGFLRLPYLRVMLKATSSLLLSIVAEVAPVERMLLAA